VPGVQGKETLDETCSDRRFSSLKNLAWSVGNCSVSTRGNVARALRNARGKTRTLHSGEKRPEIILGFELHGMRFYSTVLFSTVSHTVLYITVLYCSVMNRVNISTLLNFEIM